jgi:hypothetical protein
MRVINFQIKGENKLGKRIERRENKKEEKNRV